MTFLTQTKFPLLFTGFREPLRVYLCGISSGMPQECVSEASLAAALLFMSIKRGGGCCLLVKPIITSAGLCVVLPFPLQRNKSHSCTAAFLCRCSSGLKKMKHESVFVRGVNRGFTFQQREAIYSRPEQLT